MDDGTINNKGTQSLSLSEAHGLLTTTSLMKTCFEDGEWFIIDMFVPKV